MIVEYNNYYKGKLLESFISFKDYLDRMNVAYADIKKSGRDLYVARCGDFCDGESVLFSLPSGARAKSDGEPVRLSAEDAVMVDAVLSANHLSTISRNKIKIFEFDKPCVGFGDGDGRAENVTAQGLEDVARGESAIIFHERTDMC